MLSSTTYRLKLVIVTAFAVSVAACNYSLLAQQTRNSISPFDPEVLRAEVLKYKTWTLVNPQPMLMAPAVAALCARPNAAPQSPHTDKYISVYVNDVGRAAMLEEKSPKFPVGTIIVKEKFPDQESRTPEFFTIMVKREAGYDPAQGDWQYLTMDAAKAKLESPANLASCQACHAAWKENSDYISRAYLPSEKRQALR